ncbi:MAG: hypothetical protein AB1512_09550 [Thermodesulfobacteriota bacterium]
MSSDAISVVEPFVQRGLFASPEQAVAEMARDYVLRQIERYRATIENMQAKHGMAYEQYEAYLKSRSAMLQANPSPVLNQAVMTEEEDALDWKIAREMLASWLGLQAEAGA